MTDAEKTKWMNAAIAVGILFAISRFVPNQMVKAGAIGAAGVIVASKLPVVKNAFVA